MQYEWNNGHYVFFTEWVKSFEEASSYWEYSKGEHGYSLYYVKKGISRRLAETNMDHYTPEAICVMLADKDVTVHDCDRVETHTRRKRPAMGVKVTKTVNWSVEFDGKSIIPLLAVKPGLSFNEVKMIIQNEGGYVDDKGIIHKGSAEDKIVEII